MDASFYIPVFFEAIYMAHDGFLILSRNTGICRPQN
jgi:hypothetical protein